MPSNPWVTIPLFVFTFFLILLPSNVIEARKSVLVATYEKEPYSGRHLPQQGVINDIVRQAFEKKGYDVSFAFYPVARARHLAKQGKLASMAPYYSSLEQDRFFVFSEPFLGDQMGLLKKKSFSSQLDTRSLTDLNPYELGVVRGAVVSPEFDSSTVLSKQLVVEDLMNIDKLYHDRIQLAVIDKYTAADLLVGKRPHMIGTFEFLEPPLAQHNFCVAFSTKVPGHDALRIDFNDGLNRLKSNGQLEKIMADHGFFPQRKNVSKKSVLTIGTVKNPDMLIMKRLARQFEAMHPGITLEWRIMDENTLRKRLLSDLAISDGQFDILTIGSYEAPIWGNRGWLVPLNQALPDDYEIGDILDTVRSALSRDGILYALPFYAESTMTYYRKDLFERAGLTMPHRPSYQEIESFARQLHDPDKGIYGIALRGKPGWGQNLSFVTTMANTHGGRLFDETWRPELDSPSWKKALILYERLMTRYGPPEPWKNGYTENLDLFAEGHCAIWIDATVAAGRLLNPDQSKVSGAVGFAQAPIAKTARGSHWLWVWALAIPESSRHKKDALSFITWATSKAYIKSVAAQEGWNAVPPGTRTSTYAYAEYKTEFPMADFVLSSIQKADPLMSTLNPKPYIGIQWAGIPEFSSMGDQIGHLLASMLKGDITVDETLKQSQTLMTHQMKKSGYMTELN